MNLESNSFWRVRSIPKFLVLPLLLSACIHLWNPTGFPSIYWDEDTHYLQKALLFAKTGDPQAENPRLYAHPYFGQIFLGTLFNIIDYPDAYVSKTGSSDVLSVNLLYLIPRLVMGMLAVLDTFFLYKIGDIYYGKKVGLICSILFAVMPATWLLRRLLLDNILLPFLLSSLLLACYAIKREIVMRERKPKGEIRIWLLLISGILLGLAIFTKVPSFTIIPLFIFLIYSRTRNKKMILVWLTPVIIIPLLWPAYALSSGHFDLWIKGVVWQTEGRSDKPLINSIHGFVQNDPLLLVIGTSGLCYAIFRKDMFPLLWIVPFIVFTILVHFVSLFHLVFLVPMLCISGAKLLVEVYSKVRNSLILKTTSVLAMIVIVIFGTAGSIYLITVNLSSSYFEGISFVNNYLPNVDSLGKYSDEKVTVIGLGRYFWIPQYAYEKSGHYYYNWDRYIPPLTTKKILFIIPDGNITELLHGNDKKTEQLRLIYNQTKTVAVFDARSALIPTLQFNPYRSLMESQIPQKIEVRANY